mgnify:CR=1 FL=1|tara:strand:- start:566 stop:1462 length:897 start_codon:yes stop_codon:yes gene_type:complete
MALNINGTTGISGVDGSSSAPAVTGTDSNTGINFGSDILGFNTGGVERSRFDANGNLLIGTTSFNNGNFTGSGHGITVGGAAPQITLHQTANNTDVFFGNNGTNAYLHTADNMNMVFGTNDAERMRIDTNGRLLINTTTTSSMLAIRNTNLTTHTLIELYDTGGTGTHSQIQFNNTNGLVGQITTNGSSTTYATSSDYRLKENAVAISDGITRLKTLKPYKFNFKADTSTTLDGFFAHEVTAVPEAIIGTKDEVDSDNNPIYQGIDQSKLVPLLTAALQEAVAKIEVLETKVAALEAA